MMKLVKAIGVTLAVATGTYLTGVNILHPWQVFTFVPASDLELGIALFLTIAATAVCIWRLLSGSPAGTELKRFGDAFGGPDDLS
jgi:hypothetical protein